MLDEQSEENQERGSQFAIAVGLLLFASVVLGSGVLGDSGDARLSDGEEGADDADADPATEREQMANGVMDLRDIEADFSWEDCLGADRPDMIPRQGITDEETPRDGNMNPNTATDRPATATGTVLGTTTAGQISITTNIRDVSDNRDDPCAGAFTNAAELGMNGMFGPNGMQSGQALQSMFHQMCASWVHGEFWGNIDNMERAEDGSVSITTYAEDGTTSTDTLSAESVRAMNAALAPLVDGCVAMMESMLMGPNMGMQDGHGGGHGWDQGHDWEHDWYDDCENEEDWRDWESDEDHGESDADDADGNDEADGNEDEPRRDSRQADANDRRHGDWDPCADHHDWEEAEPLMVDMWIETDGESNGFWITFEARECAGVYDFVDDSGDVHSLEYDVCEDDYYAEEWYDEEANTWNAHWEDEDGTWWKVLNYDTCIGVLEWVDADGEDGREEWEMEDCHDEDESDEHDESDEDSEDESDEEADSNGNTPAGDRR